MSDAVNDEINREERQMEIENEPVTIDYDEYVYETEKAWLLVIEGDEHWFPKSQCSLDTKEQTISVPCWLLEQKGLD